MADDKPYTSITERVLLPAIRRLACDELGELCNRNGSHKLVERHHSPAHLCGSMFIWHPELPIAVVLEHSHMAHQVVRCSSAETLTPLSFAPFLASAIGGLPFSSGFGTDASTASEKPRGWHGYALLARLALVVPQLVVCHEIVLEHDAATRQLP